MSELLDSALARIREIEAEEGGDPNAVDTSGSAFRRGLRSGVTSLRGQFHALAGGVGEAVGATDFARERYARSRELQAQAAQEAPGSSFRDVHDLRSGYDYVTGVLGQAAPVVAPAIAAALVTKRPILAPTAVMAAPETGDIIQRQQEDPTSLQVSPQRRLATAAAGGTTSAALQSAVPGSMAEKIAGRTAATAARTATGVVGKAAETAVVGGVTSAGGEAAKQATIRQSNQDFSYDPEAIKEAGVAGGVAGGVLGLPGAAVEAAHGAANRAGTNVKDAVKGTVAKTGERAKEAFTGLFNRDANRDDATARAVSNDKPIDPLPPGADPAAHVAQSDAKATEWATQKLNTWLADSGLDAETKAKASDLLAKVSDPAARAEVAAMDIARKTRERAEDFYTKSVEAFGNAKEVIAESPAATKVRNMLASITNGEPFSVPQFKSAVREMGVDAAGKLEEVIARVKAVFEKEPTKKSEDYSGARAVVGRTMMAAIQKTNPELLKDPVAFDRVAEGVRQYVQAAKDGKDPHKMAPITAYLRMFLGADTIATLERVYTALHNGTKEENAAFYRDLVAYDEIITGHTKLADVVKGALKDKTIDVNDAVEALRRYTRGEHTKQLEGDQQVIREKLIRRELEDSFEPGKLDKVLAAFQKEYEESQAKAEMDATRGKEGDPVEGDGDAATSGVAERSLEETDLEYEPPRVYRGKNKAPILSHQAHVRDFGNDKSQFARLMERAKTDNPDRNVSFMSVDEFEKAYDFKHAVPEGANAKDYGVIVAEGQKQEGRITKEQAEAMRFDENRNTVTSKSRIKLEDGTVLDAVKVTRNTARDMPYIEGETYARRTARAFFEGLGSALVYFDTTMGAIPESTVIAVRKGGGKITYGDIHQYKDEAGRTRAVKPAGEISTTAKLDLESEIQDKRRLLGKAKTEDARMALLGEIEEMEMKVAARERNAGTVTRDKKGAVVVRRSGKDDDVQLDKIKNAHQVYEIDPEGNIHLAALEHEKVDPKTGEARLEGGMAREAEDSKRTIDIGRERGRLIAATKDKPLKDITVTTKLVDENGRELVWKGSADAHPGRMSAEQAVNEIRERRETLKRLLECLKS